jgi:AraC-like DNA-binding protein
MLTRTVDPPALLQTLLRPDTPIQVSHHGVVNTTAAWAIGPREVEEHMLFYVETGGFAGEVAGESVRLDPGHLYWQQPGVQHHLVQAPGVRETRVYFFRIGIGAEPWARLARPYLIVEERESLQALVATMVPATESTGALEDLRIRCLFGELFCRALNLAESARRVRDGLSAQQARQALAFIREHLAGRYAIAELAAHLGLHPDYFARRFKATFGVPPQTLIKTERIRLARGLLRETNLTVSEIAHRLGYDQVAYFSNQFRDVTGHRPSTYRSA